MRRGLALGLLLSWTSMAQELTPPPSPMDVTPVEPAPLPTRPPGFSTRVSFFSTDPLARFTVSLRGSATRCQTPCALDAVIGPASLSVTRDGYTLTEEHVLDPGDHHVVISPYSKAMTATGGALLGVSAAVLVPMVALLATVPFLWAAWVVSALIVSVAHAVPGIVLTVVGFHRQTMHFGDGRSPYEGRQVP